MGGIDRHGERECVYVKQTEKERHRDGREGGLGTSRAYMPCSGSQHQTAYGSPAELSERTLSMRTGVKSKSKRKESRKQ